MRRLLGQPWYYPVVFTCFGLAFAGWGAIDGNVWLVIPGLLIVAFGIWSSPAMKVSSRPASGAEEHVANGGVVLYWRPGCQFCLKLIRSLSTQERDTAYWVNIWTDEKGRAQLWEAHERRTGVLEGRPDETVPTAVSRRQTVVVTGDENIARLRQMLQAAARRKGA